MFWGFAGFCGTAVHLDLLISHPGSQGTPGTVAGRSLQKMMEERTACLLLLPRFHLAVDHQPGNGTISTSRLQIRTVVWRGCARFRIA
jgi:hypothetical protein